MAVGRRLGLQVPLLVGREAADYNFELQRFLESLLDSSDDGIPAGNYEGIPETLAVGGAGAVGNWLEGWSPGPHDHPIPTGDPAALGAAEAEGSSTSFPRLDHVHARAILGRLDGADIGIQGALNFLDSSTIDFTVTEDVPNGELEIVADVIPGGIDHGLLEPTSLLDDDHPQYFLLAGRAGGQTAIGGTLTTELLTFQDNVADARQFTFGPGISDGLLNLRTGGHDLEARHVGLGNSTVTNAHILVGSEIYTGGGSGNYVGLGLFPALRSNSVTQGLYGMQGNVFFGGNTWSAGSLINGLQFLPAPDYTGSTTFGNSNLTVAGLSTGGFVNILAKAITVKSLTGMVIFTHTNIFGGPGSVTTPEATAINIATPAAAAGTIDVETGLRIEPQLYGTVNQALWLAGDDDGGDLLFGSGRRGTGTSFNFSGGNVTFTYAGGGFSAADIGKKIIIKGATSLANNGPKIITAYLFPTTIRWADAAGVTEAFPGTWYIVDTPDARIYYDGTDLVIDPDFLTAGDRVLIGATGDDDMLLNDIEIDGDLDHDGAGIGFYGTAPIAQPNVIGAKAGNVALTNLLIALANLGLITDGTT